MCSSRKGTSTRYIKSYIKNCSSLKCITIITKILGKYVLHNSYMAYEIVLISYDEILYFAWL